MSGANPRSIDGRFSEKFIKRRGESRHPLFYADFDTEGLENRPLDCHYLLGMKPTVFIPVPKLHFAKIFPLGGLCSLFIIIIIVLINNNISPVVKRYLDRGL